MAVIRDAALGCFFAIAVAASGCFDAEDGGETEATSAASDGSGPGSTSVATTTPVTDDTTGDETTSDATSSDGTGSDDTGQAMCPATHACLAAPPADWTGPVVVREGPGEGTAGECADAYAIEHSAWLVAPDGPPANCECECLNPVGVQCGGTEVYYAAANGCGNAVPGPTLSNNICTDIPTTANDYWYVVNDMSGGDCDALSSETFDPIVYATEIRVCAAEATAEGCAEDEVCAPLPVVPLGPAVCIFRVGGHECPDAYPARVIHYTGHNDMRQCSTCTCDPPEGECTGSTVALYNAPDCPLGNYAGEADDTCSLDTNMASPTVQSVVRLTGATPDAACPPMGGDPVGAVMPTTPLTVCCTR